jgi:hypothetical protein
VAKQAKKKETAKMKLRKALEKWTEERCAEVLRYVQLRDHPPKPDLPAKRQDWDDLDDFDEYTDEFVDPK